jgi:hypothetical protein
LNFGSGLRAGEQDAVPEITQIWAVCVDRAYFGFSSRIPGRRRDNGGIAGRAFQLRAAAVANP